MRRIFLLALASLFAVPVPGCTDSQPTAPEQDRFEGMYLAPVDWPDTIVVGEVATATVRLFLANGSPYEPDEYNFFSPDIRVAGLAPTSNPASKHVIAFAPGRVSIVVDAHIYSNAAHCVCDRHARRTLDVVVVPSR